MDLSQRLDEMELAIHKPSFRKGTGRANEVNYWVFDYPPEKELEVRERVEYLKNKNDRGDDDFELEQRLMGCHGYCRCYGLLLRLPAGGKLPIGSLLFAVAGAVQGAF